MLYYRLYIYTPCRKKYTSDNLYFTTTEHLLNLFILCYCVFLNMLYIYIYIYIYIYYYHFLYFKLLYFNVEPLRVSMFVNKEITYLLTYLLTYKRDSSNI